MNGPPRPGALEEPDELERLRRRAYGPDADIAGDPAAQARLLELEAARRRRPTSVVEVGGRFPTDDGSAPDPAPVRAAPPSAAGSPPSEEAPTEPAQDAVPAPGPEHSLDGVHPAAWRRQRKLVILGAAVAVFAVVGIQALVGSVASTSPPPRDYVLTPDYDGVGADYVLAQIPGGTEPPDPHGTLDRLGLTAGDLRRYQNFQQLGVWSGESRFGVTCLIVARPDQALSDGIGTEGCSPAGVDTPADLLVLNSPTRDLVRFVLKGDYVAVYVYVKANKVQD
jgi:hypothetical protein